MIPMKPNPDDAGDQSRLFLAILISVAILVGSNLFFGNSKHEVTTEQNQEMQFNNKAVAPVAEDKTTVKESLKSRKEILKETRRIPIRGTKISGSISLKGARIDDVSLNDYYITVDNKKNIPLLSPSGSKDAYYIESGWHSDDSSVVVPDKNTIWSISKGSKSYLESGSSITLQWNNAHGLLFKRKIELDNNYLFKVTQSIINKTKTEKTFNAWHLISRHNLPKDFSGFFILHEGPLARLNNKLKEPSYKDLVKGDVIKQDNVRGWLGFTDKYWFVGIIPPAHEKFNARIIGSKTNGTQRYQTDIVTDDYTLLPGKSIEDKKFFFAGVKKLSLMKTYQKKYGFEKIELVFDFGILYLITKPFFLLLHFLMGLFGNVGLGIIAMTIVIRGVLFPLASKSYTSMAAMKKVSPQLKEIQTKYAGDRQKMQMEIFELYKREKVNPFSGCWPLIVQIPVFFALYKSILLSVELRHAPFWGWITDLSKPDPTNVFNLFGVIPWDVPSFLHIGAWPLLFCLTMVIQKRLTPPMPDKTQEQLQTYFPFIITFMLANFAVGLVIYWAWSNFLGVLQQYYILKKLGGEDVSLLRGHVNRRKKGKKAKAKDSKAKDSKAKDSKAKDS